MLQMTQMSCVGVRRYVTLIFNFLIPLGEIKRKLGETVVYILYILYIF